MSNGMIHVQRSFREFARALNKFWLVESWCLDTMSNRINLWTIHVTANDFRPIRRKETSCIPESDWSNIVRCDMYRPKIDAVGHCIFIVCFESATESATGNWMSCRLPIRWTYIVRFESESATGSRFVEFVCFESATESATGSRFVELVCFESATESATGNWVELILSIRWTYIVCFESATESATGNWIGNWLLWPYIVRIQ